MNLLNHDEGFFVWEVIIFVIFVILFKKKLWKSLSEYLKERRKKISDSLAAMESLKSEIEQVKNEGEAVKARTYREVLEIQNYARDYAGKILSEAEAEATAAYKSIIDESLLYVEKLGKDAVHELKSKTGKIVVEVAGKILRNELSAETRQNEHIGRLIKEINLNKEIHS